jgi:hypothetical protein
MVCLGNICINTLYKGAKDDDDDDNNNNNNNNNFASNFSKIVLLVKRCAGHKMCFSCTQ